MCFVFFGNPYKFSSWSQGFNKKKSRRIRDREEILSLTFIPERPCCFSRIFSGLRSQWMILFRDSTSRHCKIEWANLRTNWRLKPWNFGVRFIFRQVFDQPEICFSLSTRKGSWRGVRMSYRHDCEMWSFPAYVQGSYYYPDPE